MTRGDFLDRRSGRGPFASLDGAERPPIVFITIDMVPPEFYREGQTNSGLARTPNIDRLRGDAVAFTNAFTNSPLCGPSRACYLTGRYPYILANEERTHDGWAIKLRPDDIIFPQYLKAAGYITRHVGKSHVGTEKFMEAFGEADSPWNRWAPPMEDDDAYLAYLERLGVEPPIYRKAIRGLRPDRETAGNNYGGFVIERDGSAFPESATYPHYLAALAEEKLKAALRGPEGRRPIYLQLDFFAPHQPFMIPEGLQQRATQLRAQVDIPESFFEARDADFARMPGEPRIYELYRRDVGLYEEETLREYIVCNILQMEVLDRAIGKVVAALEALNLYTPALVLFAADHGEMNGEKALCDKGVYGHPKVARVPLLVKLPGGANRGAEVDAPVCLLDVAPSVLEAAGVTAGARLDGWSLWPLLRDPGAPAEGRWDERVFLYEAFWHIAPNPAIAIQWRKSPGEHYFYVCNLADENDELYDLNDSSHRNLACDPAVKDVTEAMIMRMYEFLRSDARWRCYLFPFRLAHAQVLPQEEGDLQMFRPE